MHIKAVTEKPAQYPERFPLDPTKVEWNTQCIDYKPTEYTSDIVINQYNVHGDKGWADPQDVSKVANKITSFISEIQFDSFQRPVNPMGRTGICGRGLLGKWGPNFAGDPIVTRVNALSQKVELVVIKRGDCLQWALPGGMVDKGEDPVDAIARELKEETHADLNFKAKDILYQGYVDDRRNTDNAWMETTVAHKHLSYEESLAVKLKADDDAVDVKWQEVDEKLLNSLYASHKKFVEIALTKLKLENKV
ncbi:MAG: hypothetical protein S4CHLAM6_05910 [Chlamydiae bacterium]|nr:hypothetical protein [Chlamydiota bacterium]